jgi:hypothetical protein
MKKLSFLILIFSALCPASQAFEFLPTSEHQLFQPFGIFVEDHSMMVLRDSSKAYGAMAAVLSLIGFPESSLKPQIIISGAATSTFNLPANYGGFETETIDARFSALLDLQLSETLRLSFGWTHESGHIGDDLTELSLMGYNLGNESFPIRLVGDFEKMIRWGFTLRPIFDSIPRTQFLAADQFLEIAPFGESADKSHGNFFIAASLSEWGRKKTLLTFNTELGWYFGKHFDTPHTSILRFCAGYYNGWNPSLKYAEFLGSRMQFVYLAAIIDI